MNSVRKWVGVAAVLVMAAAVPAKAQVTELLSDTSPFYVPNSSGWQVQLSTCAYTNNGAAGDCSTENVVASVTGSTLSLVFGGTNGTGSNNFLANSGLGAPNPGLGLPGHETDLSINVTVTAPSGQKIYLASDTLNTATGQLSVTATESFTSPSETTLNTSSTGLLLASETFAPTTSAITPNIDVVDGLGGASSSIQSVTLKFSVVPEPVSSSLLAVGLVGLGFIRRKVRRPR
jgi:hypothetical protein